jgi:23S rRNA (uracil1939-C5)-methyltransferase
VAEPDALEIESLDHEGRGVGRRDGKVVFVEGALPRERVRYTITRRKASYESAQLVEVMRSSNARVAPRCAHFGVCGGCSLQHLDFASQVAVKQRTLEDNLRHIGNVRAEQLLSPIAGPAWGYRMRARFSVRYVTKKGGTLVGFHERSSSYVADMRSCEVVPPRVSRWLPLLRTLIDGLSIRGRLPQIELAIGDTADVMVFRILEALSADDERALRDFSDLNSVQIFLQTAGPETARSFHPPDAVPLAYRLPDFDVELQFSPTEFTQVNSAVNRVLVRRALRLLEPQAGERIADFFCGLGNFSLPIARSGASVVGYEGAKSLVARATGNAARNGLAGRATFVATDLFKIDESVVAAWGPFDRMLIDPPRDGAMALVKALPATWPRRIVYVSCSPSTLARDAGLLVHTKGFRLRAAGIANMFPHTSHVESIACFDRDG